MHIKTCTLGGFSSSITDSGIGMICNVFPDTLTRLLLAFCPNITSSKLLISHLHLIQSFFRAIDSNFFFLEMFFDKSGGIQYATAQLPLLELMDCGMTVSDPDSDYHTIPEKSPTLQKTQLIGQKMFIKHSRLKKLSLWGCSKLDVRFLLKTTKCSLI